MWRSLDKHAGVDADGGKSKYAVYSLKGVWGSHIHRTRQRGISPAARSRPHLRRPATQELANHPSLTSVIMWWQHFAAFNIYFLSRGNHNIHSLAAAAFSALITGVMSLDSFRLSASQIAVCPFVGHRLAQTSLVSAFSVKGLTKEVIIIIIVHISLLLSVSGQNTSGMWSVQRMDTLSASAPHSPKCL